MCVYVCMYVCMFLKVLLMFLDNYSWFFHLVIQQFAPSGSGYQQLFYSSDITWCAYRQLLFVC